MNMMVAPHRFGFTAPLFVPNDLASLQAWYRGDLEAGAGGSAVNTWEDRENSWDASFTGNSPTVGGTINGLNTINFPSGSGYTVSTSLLAGASAASYACVYKKDTDPGSFAGAIIDGFGTNANTSHHPYTDSVVYEQFATSVRKTVGDPTPSLASPRIVVCRSASADFTWHLDGTSVLSTGTNTVGIKGVGVGTRYIGREAGGTELRGQIAELCLFDAALIQADREKIEGYLAHKWGLTAGLPALHPYKSVAP